MKILFLDIDGCLNGHDYDKQSESSWIKPECVTQLNRVLDITGCEIVISSAWRYMILNGACTIRGFEYMLRTHRIHCKDLVKGYLDFDETQDEAGRASLIRRWVSEHKPKRWAVLDDLLLPIDPIENFVRTDGQVGLTEKEADRLIQLLR